MTNQQSSKMVVMFCLVVGWVLFTLNADAQTINVDIQSTGKPVYSGSDGVLSTTGTFWNDSSTSSIDLKDEFGSATSVDVVLGQWTGSISSSGSHALFGDGLTVGWSSPVMYEILDLDPHYLYDIAVYFQSSRGDVSLIHAAGSSRATASLGNSQVLPGTEGGEYLRFRAAPFEMNARRYGFRIYAYSKSSIITDAIAGIQIKNTNIPIPNIGPYKPIVVSPTADAIGISLAPILTASAFEDPDAGDTHLNSRWQVDNNNNFASPEWDSGDTYAASISASVPSGILSPSTKYYWRVRYKDSAGNWSIYSVPSSFTTIAKIVGDLDGSGQMDLVDAILALQVTAGIQTTVPLNLGNEVGGNNKIGIEDAVFILQNTAH